MTTAATTDHGTRTLVLGLSLALARAAAPLAVGLLWSPARGYTSGLALLLVLSVLGVAALWAAQRRVADHRRNVTRRRR